MLRGVFGLLVLIGVVCGGTGKAEAAGSNYRGPFEGRVVDADTEKPIQGAVVWVGWWINHAFSGSTFFDAAEVITDANGFFHVPKKWSLNPWRNLVMSSYVMIVKAGYWHDRTSWVPIIEAAEILRSLPPDEREKRGAGCDRAVGDSEMILGCSAAKEQGPGERASVTGIRLQDGKPVFLLQKLPAGGIEYIDTGGRDVPDSKRRLLRQEIEKMRENASEMNAPEIRMHAPEMRKNSPDEKGPR